MDRQPVTVIIDDDPSALSTLSVVLLDSGYIVRSACDGLSGLRIVRECAPDLVLTDMLMPGLDGVGVIMAVRRERPRAQIIAMSGYGWIGHTDFQSIADGLGVSAILRKPFDAEEVVSICRALLLRSFNSDSPVAADTSGCNAVKLASETARRLGNLQRSLPARMHSASKPRKH